jgi:uncharacterized protein
MISIPGMSAASLSGRLLRYLFSHSNQRFYVRELARHLRVDPTNLSRELAKYEADGLCRSETKGKLKFYSVNREHPLYNELRALLLKMMGPDNRLETLLSKKRAAILNLAGRHGASNVRVFGSIARGEAAPDSDIDLLVKMKEGRSYFDLVGLWQDLEELLKTRVDVLADDGLSPHLQERILKEARPL